MVAVDSENLVDGLAPESDLAPHAAGNDLSASSSHRKHRSQWTSHALSHVLAIALVFFGADQVLLHVGGDGWLREGPVDELAHLLTGALVLAALRGGVDRRFAAGLLVMSVLIDIDHVPGLLGVDWITRGTDRPYTHSLLMLAVVGLAAVGWRRRRSLLLGALLGLGAHLARDLSESSSGVPLAWPLSLHSFTLPHWTYLLAMSAVLAVALWRAGAPWRRVLPVVLVVAGLATAATAAASLPVRRVPVAMRTSTAEVNTELGVYVGANQPALVGRYQDWLGRPIDRVLDYLGDESWSQIESPTWWTSGWGVSAWRHRMIYSVPMLPATGGSIEIGARGGYDSHFRKLAQTLVSAGQGDVVMRPGWEGNGDWYRWSAAGNPKAYVRYFRHIVKAMRGVSGAQFRFDWSVSMGPAAVAASVIYPGDAYVDYIGMDVYDQYWGENGHDPAVRWNAYLTQPYGLRWHKAFAMSHGKRMTLSEWGVIKRSDGYGGGDDPYFVDRMRDWISANNVAYAVYFERDTTANKSALTTGRFPESAAAMLRGFGTPARPRSLCRVLRRCQR